jgi:hypothetical protein
MAHVKLSVTLEQSVANELREITGRRGVSAFVNDAVRQRLQAIRVRRLLNEMEAEVGPIPDEVQRAVDALPWPE